MMKKSFKWTLLIAALLMAFAAYFQKELVFLLTPQKPIAEVVVPTLWKVSKPGIPDSWLFGTMHAQDRRSSLLLNRIEPYLSKSERIFTEHKMYSAEDEVVLSYLQSGQGKIRAELGALYPDFQREMQKRQIPPPLATSMDLPQAVFALYVLPPFDELVEPIDYQIAAYALIHQKQYAGLEKMQDKITPFSNIPAAVLPELVRLQLEHAERVTEQARQLVSDYYARTLPKDVETESPFPNASKALLAAKAEFDQTMSVKRNQIYMRSLQSALPQGGNFIAVGIMHLQGESGLVQQLRLQGFTLTPLY